MVVVLSEAAFRDQTTVNGRELHAMTETARLMGCRIYSLPADFSVCETADNALAYVPEFDPPVPGVWVGYIPSVQRYTEIYNAAAAKGVWLVNSPDQHQTAMEFDRFYPALQDLTPRSLVIRSIDECILAEQQLGFPVFVKGAVKSYKELGWTACVAFTPNQLRAAAEKLFAREVRSRGKVIVRQLVKFRSLYADFNGFTIGREYRVFVYRERVLTYGFYWDDYTDVTPLTRSEESAVLQLAKEASRRLAVPLLAVDIGQLVSGEWIVIEVGDGQFSGLSRIPVLEFWSQLKDIELPA